jgi:hypothetical protein
VAAISDLTGVLPCPGLRIDLRVVNEVKFMFEITEFRMRQALQTNGCNNLDSITAN